MSKLNLTLCTFNITSSVAGLFLTIYIIYYVILFLLDSSTIFITTCNIVLNPNPRSKGRKQIENKIKMRNKIK